MSLYLRPRTLDEAVQALAASRGTILSGGTDFFPALGERCSTGPVVDISAVDEIRGISIGPDSIRIGGRTTWTEIASSTLPRGFDGLKAAAREVGSVQIQNFATVAGNLCNASPAADGVPPLLTLDAQLTLASVAGSRTVPLAEFITGNRRTLRRPEEILAAITIPRRLENSKSVFLKLGARRYLVISIAMVAVLLLTDERARVAEARVAVGSCSAKAQRLVALEHELVGKPLDPGLVRVATARHLETLSPIDDVRATAVYRREAALLLVQRALESCAGDAAHA
jgi:CO/xanthine dehydrogenase FAD-binding subunit